ncbi:MAG: 2-isopropylmalate synthase, partial [Chloroflexi bacterium]|nr:2-isopropylmalate synthase [Chloroflexota bacterium]
MSDTRSELIYDWNATPGDPPARTVGIVDETLRDGLQSPSVTQPSVADKLGLLALMAQLGVDDVNLGIPGAGSRFAEECLILAREVMERRLPLACHCAARTLPADIAPIAEISQRAGIRVGVGLFIGSSPIRRYAEGWDLPLLMLRRTRKA